MSTRILHVREGGKYALVPEDITALTPYYGEKITEFLVLEPPSAGSIRSLPTHESVPLVRSFSPKQLNESRIVVSSYFSSPFIFALKQVFQVLNIYKRMSFLILLLLKELQCTKNSENNIRLFELI